MTERQVQTQLDRQKNLIDNAFVVRWSLARSCTSSVSKFEKKLEIQNQELSLAKLNDSSDSIGLDLMQKKIIFEQKIYNRTDVLQL